MFIRADYEASYAAHAEVSNHPDERTDTDDTELLKFEVKLIFPFLVELRKELNEKGPLTQEQYKTANTRAFKKTTEDNIKGIEAFNLRETNPYSKAFNEKVIEMAHANLEDWYLLNDPSTTEEQLKAADERDDRLHAELDKILEDWPDSKPHRKKKSED